MLETLVNKYNEGYLIVYGKYEIVDEFGNFLKMPYEQGASGFIMDKLWSRNYISISCIIVQKELLTKHRFKEEFNRVGDIDLWLRLSEFYYFFFVNEKLQKSRDHE